MGERTSLWVVAGDCGIFPVDLANQMASIYPHPDRTIIYLQPQRASSGLLIEPVKSFWHKFRARKQTNPISLREIIKSTPWLLPGLITLSVLILYPLIYQLAMSVTDFSGPSIKDGIQGGVWRAAWEGLTGQVEAVDVNPSTGQPNYSQKVNYTGPNLIKNLFTGNPQVLVFEILWTVLIG